jgi:hypothetical protein
MTTAFNSFNRSPLGAFCRSGCGARGKTVDKATITPADSLGISDAFSMTKIPVYYSSSTRLTARKTWGYSGGVWTLTEAWTKSSSSYTAFFSDSGGTSSCALRRSTFMGANDSTWDTWQVRVNVSQLTDGTSITLSWSSNADSYNDWFACRYDPFNDVLGTISATGDYVYTLNGPFTYNPAFHAYMSGDSVCPSLCGINTAIMTMQMWKA